MLLRGMSGKDGNFCVGWLGFGARVRVASFMSASVPATAAEATHVRSTVLMSFDAPSVFVLTR